MTQDLEFSLIIPTLNERENIILLLGRLEKVLSGIRYEVIVVDDDSEDGTGDAVTGYARDEHPEIRLMKRQNQSGLSSAVLAGLDSAVGTFLGVMDADLSHDEALWPGLLKALREGADLAVASRRIPGGGADHWPWYRRLTSNLGTWLSQICLRIPLSDPMSGFFCMRKSFFQSCRQRLNPRGYKILLEIYVQGHPSRLVELPFVFKDRKQGHSKLTLRVLAEYLGMLIRLSTVVRPSDEPVKQEKI